MVVTGRRRFRRWILRSGIVAVAVAAALTAATFWFMPVALAYLCPACFGFELLGGKLYIEAGMPAEARARLLAAVDEGEKKVALAYGELWRAPLVLACFTASCDRRIGGRGARGVAYGEVLLRLSPLGLDPVIIGHERSHIEFHARLGFWLLLTEAVPAWFDEGLAVIVADDARYLLPGKPGTDRCRGDPEGPLPVSRREWGPSAGRDPQLYARAACRVWRWMNANNGMSGVLALIDQLRAGKSFEQIYREP
jgi:hypothetical protein